MHVTFSRHGTQPCGKCDQCEKVGKRALKVFKEVREVKGGMIVSQDGYALSLLC